MMKSVKSLKMFISKNKNVVAVNEFTIDGLDTHYLYVNGKLKQNIHLTQYTALREIPHTKKMIGQNRFEMHFNLGV